MHLLGQQSWVGFYRDYGGASLAGEESHPVLSDRPTRLSQTLKTRSLRVAGICGV